jgi:hypothetical protein
MAQRSNAIGFPTSFSRDPAHVSSKALVLFRLSLAAGLLLAGTTAPGSNLLVNPGFESAPSGHTVPAGWTYYSDQTSPSYFGDYWVEQGTRAHSGTFYWKQWDALNNSAQTDVAGIFQDFSSAAGSAYQASGWFYTPSSDLMGPDGLMWVEVAFLNAATNPIALYKTANFSASVGADVWVQYSVTNVCDLSSPLSGGDPNFPTYTVTGSVTQLVAPVGVKTVRYRLAYSQAGIRGSIAFDDAVLNQVSGPIPPVISNVFPLNMIFVNPSDGLSFNVSSPSGFTINNSGIHVALNGVDVSGALAITGSSSNKNVAYHGLQSNLTYTASITVTDSFNLAVSASTYFETTWVGVPPIQYLWEAEDFDFNNGMYINNPNLCNTSGDPNCYFGKVGVEGQDEHNLNGGGSHLYRASDPMGTAASGDYSRKNLFQAGRLDYCINPFNFSEWVNYTRDWPHSTNWVIARLATDIGLSGTLTLSVVNPDTTTTDLGTFSIPNGHGWTTFENVYLKDTNGFLANVVLNGKATLRVTSGGNLLPNFFMLVPAQVDLPTLSGMYPTGTHPFEYTNSLAFTVASFGGTFPAGSIKVNLDGNDISTNLVLTGPASTQTVIYPKVLPNAIHTAIITVTNSLGHGFRLTNHFDTFSENNFMVEAEDYDYGGGQFITPWVPDAYADYNGPYPAVTNVDYQHISLTGEQFKYRSDGIPQDGLGTHDYLRQSFSDVGGVDYVLTFFAGTDWANYTRVYPTGAFYVYGRFSGGGPFSMYLDQVISGTGTTSQVTKRLGHWGAVGQDYVTYAWVPLTDDGLVAPVVVNLNGLATLRITTDGFCNPNFFMMVPAAGIRLTAARSGGNVVISFPTQAGAAYRVFYRTNLTTGNWNLLNSVLGDGTVKSISDPSGGTNRYYKVVAP